MADHIQLETTIQALLVKLAYDTDRQQGERIACRSSYLDAAEEIADFRMNRSDEAAKRLAEAGEALVSDLDDIAHSGYPEWEAASQAIDPYVK